MYHYSVIIESESHKGKERTGAQMRETVNRFYSDLGRFLLWPFAAWFDYVKVIPYAADEDVFSPDRIIEVVARPSYLLDREIFPFLDCKKKAILIASWARGNGFPFRFVAVSNMPDKHIHHVLPQINFALGWENCDATFPTFEIGQANPATYAVELT